MGSPESTAVADIIEIEQLLARYAVGMTKDDVESVMQVFTTDGTYRAFGDTYALADFPTLVKYFDAINRTEVAKLAAKQ